MQNFSPAHWGMKGLRCPPSPAGLLTVLASSSWQVGFVSTSGHLPGDLQRSHPTSTILWLLNTWRKQLPLARAAWRSAWEGTLACGLPTEGPADRHMGRARTKVWLPVAECEALPKHPPDKCKLEVTPRSSWRQECF